MKHQQTKTFQNKRYKTLKKKAWRLFSLFIRKSACVDSDKTMTKCYTCDVILPISEMQAGHFHHNKLDFDVRNIHAQCPRCNMYLSGNLAIYATKLCQEIGLKGMAKLLLDSNTITYTIEDLENIIENHEN